MHCLAQACQQQSIVVVTQRDDKTLIAVQGFGSKLSLEQLGGVV
jgi:hypothetical protein